MHLDNPKFYPLQTDCHLISTCSSKHCCM